MASTIPRPFTVRIPAFYPPSGSLKRARASSSTFQTGTSTPASFSSTSLRTTTMTDATSDDEVVVLDGPPPQTLAQRVGGSSEPVSKKPKVEAIVIDDDDDEEEEASDEGKDDGDDYEQPDEEDDETEDDDDTVVDEIVSALVGSKPGVIRPGREVGGKKLRDRPHTLYAPVRSHTKKRKPSKPSPKVVLKLGPNPSSASDEAHREALAASEALDLKRRAFFRKHRPAFLALLPEQNNRAFLNLLEKPLVTASSSSKTDGIVPVAPFQMLPQPKGIKGSMHNYQLHGFSFLVNLVHSNGVNAILADEMGLGKTLQTIALLVHINSLSPSTNAVQIPKTKGHVTARKVHLIICPLSVLSAWMTEVNRWSSLKAVRFHGEKKERDRLKGVLKEELGTIDIVLTTYEAYVAEASWFKSRSWGACVLDEGHRIKNADTIVAQALQGIGATYRLILTGTPLQNNLVELWAILHWLYPMVFTAVTEKAFQAAFDLSKGTYDQDFLKASRKLLELVMLRRTKEGVKTQLSVPSREEITLYVPLSVCQRFWTKRLLMKQDDAALKDIFNSNLSSEARPSAAASTSTSMPGSLAGSGTSTPAIVKGEDDDADPDGVKANIRYAVQSGQRFKRLMSLLMQLRKVCCHPYLMPDSEPEPFGIAEHLVGASAKLVLLDKLLGSLLPKGHKVLIFSGFTSMLDILEDYLVLRKTAYLRLDGSTSRPRRNLNIQLFQKGINNDPAQGPPVFLISTRARGLGINLTAADTVVLFDSQWNPQVDIQAIARAHRIGQTKPVTVYRLVCHESVEHQMLGRIAKKLYLSLKIMGSAAQGNLADGLADGADNDMPSLSSSELCAILKGGSGALVRPWGSDANATDGGFGAFQKASFEECVARGREADARRDAKIAQEVGDTQNVDEKAIREAEEEERELLKGVEQVQSRLFEGKRWERPTSDKDIGREWQEMVKRERKATTVKMGAHTVQADTVSNGRWEAVKTITSDKEALKKLQDVKRERRKFGHESWCIVCRDGGAVYECMHCPRVLHGECSGRSKAQLDRQISFCCSQHACAVCRRSTAEAGNLLFRCRYCKDAYCEDCLPEDDFISFGDVLPEYQVLGYGYIANAHFIHCGPCQKTFKKYPAVKADWMKEIAIAEKELEQKRTREARDAAKK